MTIKEKLKEKNMTIYRLAKASGLPYATVNDICSGKAKLEKCSAETIYRIAHALDVSMEDPLPASSGEAVLKTSKARSVTGLKSWVI